MRLGSVRVISFKRSNGLDDHLANLQPILIWLVGDDCHHVSRPIWVTMEDFLCLVPRVFWVAWQFEKCVSTVRQRFHLGYICSCWIYCVTRALQTFQDWHVLLTVPAGFKLPLEVGNNICCRVYNYHIISSQWGGEFRESFHFNLTNCSCCLKCFSLLWVVFVTYLYEENWLCTSKWDWHWHFWKGWQNVWLRLRDCGTIVSNERLRIQWIITTRPAPSGQHHHLRWVRGH